MLAIRLTFPGQRYHATPWDHHVNEGVVEWPPTPWRLLRALTAVWHRKAPDIPEEAIRSIVNTLSQSAPSYALPPTVASHTRHYMPPFKGNTTKVFDAFLHVGKEAALDVVWPEVDLSATEREALATLLGRLSYLGRAESWVLACLVDNPQDANTAPLKGHCDDESEIVRVLSPVSASDYEAWQHSAMDEQVTRALQQILEKKKEGASLGKKDRDKAMRQARAKIPEDLFAALHLDTSDIRKAAWSVAPGAHWVDYQRPRLSAGIDGAVVAKSRRVSTVARFAVISKLAPPLTKGIQFAEVVRRTLLKLSDGHVIFRGRDAQSNGPALGHGHSYILPEANDSTGRITHVYVVARSGFDEEATDALYSLRRLFAGHAFEAHLSLIGIGSGDDFVSTASGAAPLLGTGSTWRSRTPFVATRHAKWQGRDINGSRSPKCDTDGRQLGSAEHDLVRLLMLEGFPKPTSIRSIESTWLRSETHWRHFDRWRKRGGGRNAGHRGFGFEIQFPTVVTGPIVVGYAAHFGLGCFVPVGEE